MHKEPPHFETRFLHTFDDTQLAYYVSTDGQGKKDWILLCNGLGGNVHTWRHLTAHFKEKFRFVSWDYRGTYLSSLPKTEDYSIEAHAADALAVADSVGAEEFILFGWSMGVQVALEVWNQARSRTKALVLMDGAAARPVERALSWFKPAAVAFLRLIGIYSPALREYAQKIAWRKPIIKLLKLTGFVANTLDEAVFRDLVREFVTLDFVAYSKLFVAMDEYDASEFLHEINVPTLVVVGENDMFTPVEVASEMARQIPTAELYVIPGASHYAAVEFPELLNLRLEKFFTERVYNQNVG